MSETTKVSKSDFFESATFLKGSDIKDNTQVTIESFETAKTKISEKPRPILRLKGYEFPMGLNVTNFNKMVEKFGDDTKNWVGKKIVLRRVMAPNPQNGGKETPAIRIA